MLSLTSLFLELSRREKIGFVGFLLLRILSNGLDILGLALIALVASALTQPANGPLTLPLTNFSFDPESSVDLAAIIIVLAGLFLLKSVLGGVLMRRSTLFLAQIDSGKAREIANYFFSAGLTNLSLMTRGEINWSIMRSSQSAFGAVLFSVGTLMTETTLLVGVLVLLFIINPFVTLGLFVYFLVVIASFTTLASHRTRRLGGRFESNSARSHEILEGLIDSYREAFVGGRVEPILDWLFQYRKQQARDWAGQRFLLAVPRYLIEMALVGGIALLVLVQIFADGSLSNSQLGVIFLGGMRLMATLLPIQTSLTELRVNLPQAARALDILRMIRVHTSGSGSLPQAPAEQAPKPIVAGHEQDSPGVSVVATNLKFKYTEDAVWALDGLNLDMDPGTFHALAGASGAGKSTLADCLLGLIQPREGSVTLDGLPSLHFVRKFPGAVGFVPQKPGFIPGSLLENIALRRQTSEAMKVKAMEALEFAGLEQLVSGLPDGLESQLGNHLNALSGGQLQRLSIARAIFNSPGLLVLDEPTSALDAEAETVINQAIAKLVGKTTVLLIAHRLKSLEQAQKIHFLEGGKVKSSGSFTDLRSKEPKFDQYARLLGIESARNKSMTQERLES